MGNLRPEYSDSDGDESVDSPRYGEHSLLAAARGTNKTKRIETDADGNLYIAVANGSVNASQLVFSTVNSSASALGSSASFTGTWEDMTPFNEVMVRAYGTPSNASGTLFLQGSRDGVTVDSSVPVAVPDLSQNLPFPFRVTYRYFRVKYDNGSVAQTVFKLDTIFYRAHAKDLTRTPAASLGVNEPVTVVRSFIEPNPFQQSNILSADREPFGAGIVTSRTAILSADFSKPLANNRVTSSVSGGGSTAQASGQATMTTGTGTTASARLQTIRSIRYSPGHGQYAFFTARFTTPTSANSNQRIGLYDDNNGFFIGYNGTSFGFTVRSGGSDTFTAQTSFNRDRLAGSGSSRFTRLSLPEPLDPTKLNVFRIRFGWLGSAVVNFDVMAPDGHWVNAHTVLQPNSATTPHIQSPNLPLRAEVVKSSADATSLVVGTGSWVAGKDINPDGLEPYSIDSREEVAVNSTTAGAATPLTSTLYTVNTGRVYRVTDMVITITNTLTTGGVMVLRDGGSGGPVIVRLDVAPGTATTKQETILDHTFRSPAKFTTNIFLDMPAVGVGGSISVSVFGYEEAA